MVADGLTDDEAATLAEDVLVTDLRAVPSRLVVEVVSAQRHYGRLAAIHTVDGGFFREEERLLAVYAGHAAAALDAATALEVARRGERAANLLLALARGLAAADSADAVCQCLARRCRSSATATGGPSTCGSAEQGELRLCTAVGIGASDSLGLHRHTGGRGGDLRPRVLARPEPALLVGGHGRATGGRADAGGGRDTAAVVPSWPGVSSSASSPPAGRAADRPAGSART